MRGRNSRKLSKRFELWQTSSVDDGFGGEISSYDILITSSWAEIKTMNAGKMNRSTDNGITSATNVIVIKTRKREDLTYNNINQYIKYRGDKYIVSNQPYEIEFDNMYVEIIATKEEIVSVTELEPIGNANIARKMADDYFARVLLDSGIVEAEVCLYDGVYSLL